ncbi:hypothetical protein [Bradyrhizobium genosp. P]|uniref:hypothetical protein n=1 Tax=Bradyrhizobium genosp. P TaxID=83641 RepID=UPI003CF5D5D9
MKAIILAIAVPMLVSLPVHAQERRTLPEIVVGTPPPSAPQIGGAAQASGDPRGSGTHQRCVDVTIGHDSSYSCINEKLKREVDRVNPPVANIPPIDARSSDLKVGVANVPGVQQQYGRNFGVSVYPYRPPAPVYLPPTGRR